MEQAILVYLDLMGVPIKVGQIWSRFRNGRESMSFEYDRNWLNNPKRFSLDLALKLVVGSFHAALDKPLFGAIDDSAPDRWGRLLMRRSERKIAEREKRNPRALKEIDFLLMVDDEGRQGAASVAYYFDLDNFEAKKIFKEVGSATALWREEAARLKIKKTEIDRMASAFEHEDFEKALK